MTKQETDDKDKTVQEHQATEDRSQRFIAQPGEIIVHPAPEPDDSDE